MRYLLATARPILEDMAGTAVFYLLFLATGSAALGAGVGLAIGFAQVVRHRLRREKVPTLLLLGVGLTMVLGGLSLIVVDPRFLLLKPSIVYAVIGGSMLPRGWLVRYVPEIARDLIPARTFDRAGWGWAALMFATALLNALAVVMLPPGRAAALFVECAIGSKLALFAGQYCVLRARAASTYRARHAAAG